jgi:hypothetical protein
MQNALYRIALFNSTNSFILEPIGVPRFEMEPNLGQDSFTLKTPKSALIL